MIKLKDILEQWPSGPFGKEHDYSDYGGPFGDRKHKTDFKKGPGKTPTKSISHGREEEEAEDAKITGYKTENFADGKNPGRKGLSKRVGIPKGATLAQLEKIAKNSTGERRKMAQWQLNMRRGKNKSK